MDAGELRGRFESQMELAILSSSVRNFMCISHFIGQTQRFVVICVKCENDVDTCCCCCCLLAAHNNPKAGHESDNENNSPRELFPSIEMRRTAKFVVVAVADVEPQLHNKQSAPGETDGHVE